MEIVTVWKSPLSVGVEEILQELRREVSVDGLLREIRDVGADFMLTCPFHANGQERKPSLGVSKSEVRRGDKTYEAGTCHCYSCGYTADLPKFVADLLELGTPVDGFKWILNRYSYGAGRERVLIELDLDRTKKVETPQVIDSEQVASYHADLLRTPKALRYLAGRQLSVETAKQFQLGYNSTQDSLVIPIYDRSGNVLMLKERSLEGKRFYNTKGAEKAGLIFGLYQALERYKQDKDLQTLWVTEAEIDCMTLWERQSPAVSIMGSHISDQQIAELVKSPFRRLVASLDNDEAGRKGIRHLKDKLIPLGFRIFNVRWNTTKKDVNDLTTEEFHNLELY